MLNTDLLYPSNRQPVLAANVVATSQPLAAQAGLHMLRSGGNAVDAAVAAAAVLTVVEPTGCGLGSDAFAFVWDGAALRGLNASGRSPGAWTPERFAGQTAMPIHGWDSVTVPGAVSAWVALSRRFGRLPFARLFEPAIAYARDGFAVSPTVAALWESGAAVLSGQPGFAAAFLPQGRPPRAGERFRNADLARSLTRIAESEGEDFYRGELARRIVRHAAEHGGALSDDDMAAHSADWCDSLTQDFCGTQLHEIPPNGQGLAALIALGILDRLQIGGLSPDSPESLHLQLEAMKLAFADIDRYLADPAAMTVPPTAFLDADYLDGRAALIDRRRAGSPLPGTPRRGGTVYLTAADADGLMVSFIQSNYMGFGSGVVVPETGIALQNRGSGFTLEPNHPNRVGPAKRPFHTIIPGFLMRGGRPFASFGVMGGAMQAQGHVQVVLRLAAHGQNPQAALDAPRWRVERGGPIAVESTIPPEVVGALTAMGHTIVVEAHTPHSQFGCGQVALRTDAGYIAGSDWRRDGQAVGF
jgi:gamma-glutamyltranspeptidase/glutathione hydrolase